MIDKTTTAVAFAFAMAVEEGLVDRNLLFIRVAINERLELINEMRPPRIKLPAGQVWAWMNGRGNPHWERRGTGVIFPAEQQEGSDQ